MIRKFQARDAEAAFALARESPGAAQWSLASYRELGLASEATWVAERGGRVAGFLVARVAGGEAEILNVVVDKTERRLGVASGLLETARQEFVARSVSRVFLEVRETNQAALEFYKKSGFASSGFRRGYYQHPPEGAVLMEMKLTG
ncbi:MAG TPA: ribosomal protein S18-alanine N-acetyltransferase [Candidatus Saccharimonadales bacterium]|nr:ribosomal protein S18-alanine N-acetyltransferase [Candidatus Saccharimonadales bacterium]